MPLTHRNTCETKNGRLIEIRRYGFSGQPFDKYDNPTNEYMVGESKYVWPNNRLSNGLVWREDNGHWWAGNMEPRTTMRFTVTVFGSV